MEIEQNIIAEPAPALPEEVPAGVGPNNPPWGAAEGIGVWFASVLFILFVPLLFVLPYLFSKHPELLQSPALVEFAKTDPTMVLLQIVAILPAHLLTAIVAYFVVTRFRKFDFREMVGWKTDGWRMWAAFVGIMIVFLALAKLVSWVSPEQENDLIKILQSSQAAVYVVAFMATFTAPFVEEVVYRGVVYSAFQRAWGVPGAFLLTTGLFALVHVPQYWPSYSTIFLLTLLSLILTAIRVKTNNLLPCIIFHTIFNGLQSVSLIAEPFAKKVDVPDPVGLVARLLGH